MPGATPSGDGLTIELHGLSEALKFLDSMCNASESVMKRTFYRIGTLVRDTASEYAPKSPTVQDIRKSGVKQRRDASGRFLIKARGTSRVKPGGLERSIDFEAEAQDAAVFVATNSEAGAYAFRIHEEKGVTWHNRGLGTISKGSKADDEFIVRAIKDNAGHILAIIENEQDKILKKGA